MGSSKDCPSNVIFDGLGLVQENNKIRKPDVKRYAAFIDIVKVDDKAHFSSTPRLIQSLRLVEQVFISKQGKKH